MEPFHFAIALPANADSLTLLRELSKSVAQLAGLPEAYARRAQDELESLVRERMHAADADGDVEVSFTREPGGETVTVEVGRVSRGAGAAAGAGAGAEDHRRDRRRLSWLARRGQ